MLLVRKTHELSLYLLFYISIPCNVIQFKINCKAFMTNENKSWFCSKTSPLSQNNGRSVLQVRSGGRYRLESVLVCYLSLMLVKDVILTSDLMKDTLHSRCLWQHNTIFHLDHQHQHIKSEKWLDWSCCSWTQAVKSWSNMHKYQTVQQNWNNMMKYSSPILLYKT